MQLFTKYKASDLNKIERQNIFDKMLFQCNDIEWIENLLLDCFKHWSKNDWYFDGATFVKEKGGEFWEVAAFIHDSLNKMGYVGKGADYVLIKIMFELDFSDELIFERYKLFRFTWINILKHRISGTFKSSEIPEII